MPHAVAPAVMCMWGPRVRVPARRYAYPITCTSYATDPATGRVSELAATYDPDHYKQQRKPPKVGSGLVAVLAWSASLWLMWMSVGRAGRAVRAGRAASKSRTSSPKARHAGCLTSRCS
jgi:hypothetical protein